MTKIKRVTWFLLRIWSPMGTYLPLLITSFEKPIRSYRWLRLNFAVTTPMLPVIVRGSATIALAPMAM